MRVKRLEIQGFKSFKDKTVIHFDDGVTGIVGPNGCGKSNIVDSFFWVMGEQSVKHMRADGQMDLIFNGSEKYSALSMAEVTLVLATGASQATLPEGASVRDLPPHMRYEEISITRRLYRDSSSEFFINGQQCRLKDIHELFMDTGAGPKAYSIIEQGQISKIVASKPEDRRVLIEEAAGIVKFKARKKESLRKIEATQQNLLRINDIVTEVERQLGTLERQATKARQYKKHKEDLQYKELLVGRKKLFGFRQKMDESFVRIRELDELEVFNRNSMQNNELRVETLRLQITEAQRLAEDSQLALQNLQKQISQDDTKIQLHRRNVQELENSNVTLEDELQDLISAIDRRNRDQAQLEEETQKLNELFASSDQVLKAHQQKLDEAKKRAEELSKGLEQEKRDLMNSFSRQNEISNQVHGFEARVDSLSVQLNGLSIKLSDRKVDVEILEEKTKTSKESFDLYSGRSSELRSTTDLLRNQILELETNLKTLRVDEATAREDRTKADSKHKALQQLVENHEGLKADVRNILKDPGFSGSIKGVLADQIEAHPGYEYALETALRDFLDNLFVSDSESTKILLSNLKDNSSGRATFWSFDLLEKSAAFVKQGASACEVLGFAKNLVPSVQTFKDIIRIQNEKSEQILSLFEKVLIVDTLQDALTLFDLAVNNGLTIVTREGDLVDKLGRISGGSTKSLEGGILARKAELQRLSESLEQLSSKSAELKEKLIETESQLLVKKTDFEKFTAELREVDLSAKSSERDYTMSSEQFTKVKLELDNLENENEGLTQERQEIWTKLDGIRQELSGLEGASRKREAEIEERSKEAQVSTVLVSEIQGSMIQLKIEFAAAAEKVRHTKQNLERIESELEEDLSRKEEVESLMNRKLDEKDIVEEELRLLERNMVDMTTHATDLESILRERKNALEQISQELNQSMEFQSETMRTLEQTTTELNRLKLDQEKISLEYQMLLQSLFQRYGLEEAKIAPESEEEQNIFSELTLEGEVEMQAEVDKLHEKIRRLGEVNVMAVEEYDEQKKRHDFLCSQREDLNKSILDLERAIERINKTSVERFKIAFEEINSKFQRIYPIVFGGGWGKLVMTNPEDVNETGIDIIAEPPGKKVGSIQLMSGGEKALTAVALIFSIFLIKPSPFCVLDEVDAPLDDHNVGKFNSLLKEMSVKSQFIIITHNKRTMELNDKLYGVTMEEPGVSKMVSIQIQ